MPQRKDSWKAAGFPSLQKAGETGSSFSEGVYGGSNKVDRLTSQKDGQAHREQRTFLLFLLAATRRAPQYSRIDQGSQDDLPKT